jgi:uncharacterized YigZ family protein
MRKIASFATETIEIKGSKFIAYGSECQTENEARDFIAQIKRNHPKANHHCYAYITENSVIIRSSDDKEPSSTAGVVILKGIQSFELQDVCVVVVRYFGGTLLGRGGLIKAYSQATSQLVHSAGIKVMKQIFHYTLRFPYEYISEVEQYLKNNALHIHRTYDREIVISFFVDSSVDIYQDIQDITRGKGILELINTEWV